MDYLVIGRFQPYHLGHEILLSSLEENGNVYVGLIECDLSPYNPFTLKEVEDMIKTCHPNLNFLHLDKNLFKTLKIIRRMVPKGTVYVTGDLDEYVVFRLVLPFFGLKTKYIKREKIKGKKIREMLMQDKSEWEKYVNDGVRKLIESLEVKKRFEKESRRKMEALAKHLF